MLFTKCSAALLLFSSAAYAVELPTTILGAEQYDETMCVQQYADNCITSVCSASGARDCPEQCRELARDKCKEKFGGKLDVNNLTR